MTRNSRTILRNFIAIVEFKWCSVKRNFVTLRVYIDGEGSTLRDQSHFIISIILTILYIFSPDFFILLLDTFKFLQWSSIGWIM